MDKSESCKICSKRFACRRALGGHMRSHLAKLPVPPKPRSLVVESPAPRFLPSSSSLSFNRRSVVVSDGESEIEMNPTGRRSGRRPRREVAGLVAPPPPLEVVSETDSIGSVSEQLSVYEAAMCLMDLSRDKGPHQLKRKLVIEYQEEVGEDEAEKEAEKETEAEVTYTDDRDTKKKTYRCEKCVKIFPSYQALGGHKANHKRMKIHPKRDEFVAAAHKIQTIFQCEFCGEVFESGQALGSDKQVHYRIIDPRAAADLKAIEFYIDLNLPAPEEKS